MGEGALVDVFLRVAVEIAIGAFFLAERPVDVDAKGCLRHIFIYLHVGVRHSGVWKHWAISFANALARWLFACFHAGVHSAKVLSHPSG